MKKFLAILLALMMVLVSVAALAEDGDENNENNANDENTSKAGTEPLDTSEWETAADQTFTFPIEKNYTVTGGTTFPAETLSFTVTPADDNPSDGYDGTLEVADYTVTDDENSDVLVVSYPVFKKVGLYHFDIEEDAGNTQGVTYNPDNTIIHISVLVVYDYENNCLKIQDQGITAIGDDKIKTDELVNTYDMGTLTVDKTVTGNMGKKDQPFTIKVEFEAAANKVVKSAISVAGGAASNTQTIGIDDWDADGKAEVTIQLKDSETVTFSNIPAGISYTVTEDSSHAVEDPNGSDGSKGYDIDYTDETGTIAKNTTSAAKIVNDKDIPIDTGVALDSTVYMLILALALVGIVMLKVRRREEY